MQIQLKSPGNWQASSHCWTTGCAVTGGGLLRGPALHARVAQVQSEVEALDFARSAGGSYSFIRLLPDGTALAAVDRARSRPLFFCTQQGELQLSDNARQLAEGLPSLPADRLAEAEFRLMSCVSGNDTLHPLVKQLRAGELLVCPPDSGGPHIERYFRYRQQRGLTPDRADLLRRGEDAVAQAAANLIEYAAGRPVVVPLSGGMDSTMLVVALRQAGCPRLSAYTYGRPDSSELRHSRSIAEDLGLKWHPVQYGPELWRRWFNSEQRREYYAMADNLCALPHIQDFPAVAELRGDGRLAADSVIATGISVESFYGSPSQPPDPLQSDTSGVDEPALAAMILRDKYKLWPELYADQEVRRGLERRILHSIGDTAYHPDNASCYESWFTHEKMSKFYSNSVRVYEYWGLDWWLPLWDVAVIDYWQQVPPAWRRLREFTLELVSGIYLKECGRTYRPGRYETPVQRGARLMRHGIQRLPLLKRAYNRLKRDLKYDADHLAWFLLFDRARYLQLYHPKLSINSLLVLEYFGELAPLTDASSAGIERRQGGR